MTSVTGSKPNISGNLRLTGGSAYHNAVTDGKDIGVWDWSCYNNETAAALAGNFTQALQAMSCTNGVATPAAPSKLVLMMAGNYVLQSSGN